MTHLLLFLTLWLPCFEVTPAASQSELAALETRVRSGASAKGRIQALEEIAALQPKGGDPDEAISRALALGFKDDNAEVRTRTASLFDSTQHREIAVRELTKAMALELRKWKKVGERLHGFYKSSEGRRLSRAVDKLEGAGQAELDRAIEKYDSRIREFQLAGETHAGVLVELAGQLANWPAGASVNVLARALKEFSEGMVAKSDFPFESMSLALPTIDALLALGSRKSLDAVIGSLDSCKTNTKSADAMLKKVLKTDPALLNEWSIKNARKSAVKLKEHARAIHQRLTDFAARKELPRPPGSLGSKGAWRSWSTRVRSSLPKVLGPAAK